MITKDINSLTSKLNNQITLALNNSYGQAMSRANYEIFPDHLFLELLKNNDCDLVLILNHFGIDIGEVEQHLLKHMYRLESGNTGGVRYSRDILELIEAAWIIATINYDQSLIRSGTLIEPILDDTRFMNTPFGEKIKSINSKELRKFFFEILKDSKENITRDRKIATDSAEGKEIKGTALDKYTIDLTEKARNGEIDPVYGRDNEIRQVVDILSRRRKNNPILVGEAGVGKTAVVEGLALRVANKDIMESLHDVQIRNLDIGLLQAGASMKGEFEERLKSVINQVTGSQENIILFIDEAHTLIGAGGAAGVGDAANLLKPALARGQLRTIGATTWSEYKKYIEKDPALERRFQQVKIDEPDEETACIMLRGIKKVYEEHHDLSITDSAVESAVKLSKRYISGRQLPDKAVDLLDTSSARVKMASSGEPASLELKRRKHEYGQQKLESLKKDLKLGYLSDDKDILELENELNILKEEINELEDQWNRQKTLADKIIALKNELGQLSDDDNNSEEKKKILHDLNTTRDEFNDVKQDNPLVFPEVDESIVASVVSDWTGIPTGRMVKDQASALMDFEKTLGEKLIGQDHALAEIGDTIRISKSGMGKPGAPIGVFLLVGPSGVGKTETALLTADLLFGGEKMLTVINMSEYQEKHTVSQLKGSPPGYVGYGEGGILTEAVRRKPYSVVLLDEVEKADREVMNLFYQVFDKGFMRDGEGREIDFKNTVIVMTSNLGSDIILHAMASGKTISPEELSEQIHPVLLNYFQAALLARIKIIPYFGLNRDSIEKIVEIKLKTLKKRLLKSNKLKVEYDNKFIKAIAKMCDVTETGARNIEYTLEKVLLPQISKDLINKLLSESTPEKLKLYTDKSNNIKFKIS